MSKWEKKFGKYAISNLTLILILCYVVGYVLQWIMPGVAGYLTLDPYAILHGQVWRLVTWVISPPSPMAASIMSGLDIFLVMIMLYFYYSLGTSLEHAWGTWRYNVFLFTGMLLTIAGAFLCMGIYYLSPGNKLAAPIIFSAGAYLFSTYYVNMSIFFAYALTFPEAEILLMLVIPVKAKWLGWLYGGMLLLDLIQNIRYAISASAFHWIYWFAVAAIGASLLNSLIFFLRSRNNVHLSPKQIKRRAEFRQDIRRNPKITKHKCAVCGQTNEDDPMLEFRFCSKCNGNYEYCQNHLFTHTHVK